MSLTFAQIIRKIEHGCGFETGDIQNNPVRLADFTVDVNIAQDDVMAEALKNGGWNVDDFNHTKDPFITINLEEGVRNYNFTTDEEGSFILGIYKVMVKDTSGVYQEIFPVDQQTDGPSSMWDGSTMAGFPTKYDKTGNGIYLDIPASATNVTLTAGLKVFIDRESTYFTVSDTTKISGIDPLCHDYLYLKPCYENARDKGLPSRESLFRDLQVSMAKVKSRYGSKEKDIKKRIIANVEDSH